MKQAILLLLHKNFNQAQKLIRYFEGECDIIIHVDKSGSISNSEKEILRKMPGVLAVYSKYKVKWAGFSILQAEIFLLKQALKICNANYYHLLSGQDYPVRPLNNFLNFFSHTKVAGFVGCSVMNPIVGDSNNFSRLQYYALNDYINARTPDGKKKLWDFVDWQKRHGIKRHLPKHFDILYCGSAWFSINRSLVEYLVDYTESNRSFYRRMRFTFAPEEVYISTVLLNSQWKDRVIGNNNCRFISWKHPGLDCSPTNMKEKDFYRLLLNKDIFFARKVDESDSRDLIKMIDKYLLVPHTCHIEANGGWNTINILSYKYDNGLNDALIQIVRDLKVKSVCDFGCGNGIYVANMRRMGICAVGYDCNPHTIELTGMVSSVDHNCFGIADLTESVYSSTPFEVILSIAVGQYIPVRYEDIYIENLKRNSKKYIIVSWANKNFDGEGYINRKTEYDIIKKMTQDGLFIFNEIATVNLRNKCFLSEYRETILVFQRIKNEGLSSEKI